MKHRLQERKKEHSWALEAGKDILTQGEKPDTGLFADYSVCWKSGDGGLRGGLLSLELHRSGHN